MRHRVTGRKLGRNEAKRSGLFRSLVSELILRGKIQTTLAAAKAVKPLVDTLVSDAKKATLSARRGLLGVLSKEAGVRLMDTIAPSFKNRTSGFSRIIKLGQRKGDNTEMVILEWVEQMGTEGITSIKSITTSNVAGPSATGKKPKKSRDTRGARAARATKTKAKTKPKREKAL